MLVSRRCVIFTGLKNGAHSGAQGAERSILISLTAAVSKVREDSEDYFSDLGGSADFSKEKRVFVLPRLFSNVESSVVGVDTKDEYDSGWRASLSHLPLVKRC
jgi:hypothetical protein